MKFARRQILHLAAASAALPALSRIARAQTYPTRPVRWIVPMAPGDTPDILARLIGQWLSERLAQPFILDNRPGAATNIGTEAAVHARPDGYTLVQLGPPTAINATLYDKLNFNVIRDIAPVASIARAPNVMEVSLSVPAGESHLEFFSRPWTDFAILNEMDSTGSRMIRGAGGGFGSLYRMLGWFGRPAHRQCRTARLS